MSKYEQLISKCNRLINDGGLDTPISPTLEKTSGFGFANPDNFLITPDMDVEQLDQNKLLFVHAMLHRFFHSGSKFISKRQIIELHEQVKKRMNHSTFDKLDMI